MGGNLVVDDNNPNVQYSGAWHYLTGSTRQWDGAVHTTIQRGASLVIRFRATNVAVVGTVPAGNGEQAFVDIRLDDMPTVRITRTSSSNDVYDDTFWTSPTLRDIIHTLTLTNQGGSNDLNFSFDRLKLDSSSFDPVVYPPQAAPPPSQPNPPAPTPTPTHTPTPIQNTPPDDDPPSNANPDPVPGQQTSTTSPPSPGDPTSTPGDDNNGPSQTQSSRDPSATGIPLVSGTFTPSPQRSGTITQTQTQLHRTTLSFGTADPNITSGVSINGGGNGAEGKSPPLGAILGGVLGGLLIVGFIILACLLSKRRKKRAHSRLADTVGDMQEGRFVDAETATGQPGVVMSANTEKLAMREQLEAAMARNTVASPLSTGGLATSSGRTNTNSVSEAPSNYDKRHDRCFCHPHGPDSPAPLSARTRRTLQLQDKVETLSDNDDDFYKSSEGLDQLHSPDCRYSRSYLSSQTQVNGSAAPSRLHVLDIPPSYLPITRRYSTAA